MDSQYTLSNKEIYALRQVIANVNSNNIDEVQMDASFFDDLGMNSLDVPAAIMAIEDEFDVYIPDEIAERVTCLRDAIEVVAELRQKSFG